jgi:CheY-like chemotaxis protein
MGVSFHQILVVDDNATIRSVVSDMLTKMDLKVSSVENGEKGMDLFLNNKFDLVITDFNMPGMSGIDLANQIKKKSPSTAIVLMTGDDKEVILSSVKGTSVDHILFKPFTLAKMTETVQELSHS